MNDAQSTIVGLKAQDCPGGGWTGQPAEIERATVSDCLAHGVCGCIYGDAVEHIVRMRVALEMVANDVRSGSLPTPVQNAILAALGNQQTGDASK